GFDVRNVRAVMHGGVDRLSPLEARRKLTALQRTTRRDELLAVATLLKRVKNITKGIGAVDGAALAQHAPGLTEPAEQALLADVQARQPVIEGALERGDYDAAIGEIAALQPVVAKFFDDILVNAEDAEVRAARLALVATLRDLILRLADISEIVSE